jgi:hypothetical protein
MKKKLRETINYAAHECSPQQAELLAGINSYESLKEKGAPSLTLQKKRAVLEERFEVFSQDTGHSNPRWIAATVRGLLDALFDNLESAVVHEKKAMKLAKKPIERAKNENNLCDALRRLADTEDKPDARSRYLDEAVDYGFAAVARTSGENVGMVITFAQALCLRGDLEEADALFKATFQNASLGRAGDAATAHLKFDGDLRAMSHLPTVERAIRKVESKPKNTRHTKIPRNRK